MTDRTLEAVTKQIQAMGCEVFDVGLFNRRSVLDNEVTFGAVNANRHHYELATAVHGPDQCGRLMRKFGIKYAALHPNWQQVREAFIAVKRLEDWQAVLDHWYSEDLPGRRPPLADTADLDDCDNQARPSTHLQTGVMSPAVR